MKTLLLNKLSNIDSRIVYLVLGMISLFLLIVMVLAVKEKKNNDLWNGKGIRHKQGKLYERFLIKTYKVLSSFPISKGYMEKLSYRYRFICPCDSKEIAIKSGACCLLTWGICILAFIIVYLVNPRINTLITAVVAIYVANAEVVGRMTNNFEIKSLLDMQIMILNVQDNFFVQHRADDALYRSINILSPNMKKAAENIYQLLLSDNKDEALREYYENVPNKYLREFVIQCICLMERGEQIVDGKVLFIKNLDDLYRQIDIEVDKLQRLRLEFLGIILCVVAPVFCIDYVKQFAINIKENMEKFFYGKEGFLCDIALLTIIACIYFIMRKSAEYRKFHLSKYRFLYAVDRIPFVKKAMDNYCEKNASRLERLKRELKNDGSNIRPRHFVLRGFLLAFAMFIISIGTTSYLHILSKEQLLTVERADIEVLTSVAKESQYKPMGQIVKKYTHKYVKKGYVLKRKKLVSEIEEKGGFYNTVINEALADEIIRRVNTYKKEHFSLIDLIICMTLCVIASYIPKIILKYNSAVSKDVMEDEVNQFNELICMLMYVDSMTVKQILEEMETFAVVFKQSIRICINDYGSGDINALNELKEQEPFEPFSRLVDNLVRCDDMPIYEAFKVVDVERDGYMAKRKLANEKSIRRRVHKAYILAAIPFLLLFAYGTVPTLLSSINEINATLYELQNSSM